MSGRMQTQAAILFGSGVVDGVDTAYGPWYKCYVKNPAITTNPDCAGNKGMCCESKNNNCHVAAKQFNVECSRGEMSS